ncbi:FKBP-type peptidyl-prolyl cis-trans isomerase N-terminal domain-containing protein [Acidobacteriota bacterium]
MGLKKEDKKIMLCRRVILVFMLSSVYIVNAQEPKLVMTESQRTCYALGHDIAQYLKTKGYKTNLDVVILGVKHGLNNEKYLLNHEERREVIAAFNKELKAKHAEKLRQLSEENMMEGEAFLVRNQGKDGVVSLSSGLQYEVIREGAGESPKFQSTIEIHYRGVSINGEEFYNNKEGRPERLELSKLSPGLKEAVQRMKVGSIWWIVVPSSLAKDVRAIKKLGPDAVLVYEVELKAIE